MRSRPSIGRWAGFGTRTRRRRRAPRAAPLATGARETRWAGVLASLALLTFGGLFATAMTAPLGPQFGVSPMLSAGLALAPVAAVFVGLFLFLVALAWFRGWWGTAARLHATLVLIGACVLVWQMNYWNAIGGRI